jgi:hypothetical protein
MTVSQSTIEQFTQRLVLMYELLFFSPLVTSRSMTCISVANEPVVPISYKQVAAVSHAFAAVLLHHAQLFLKVATMTLSHFGDHLRLSFSVTSLTLLRYSWCVLRS